MTPAPSTLQNPFLLLDTHAPTEPDPALLSSQVSLLHRPQPRTWGHTKTFLLRLYKSLLALGYSHPDILAMSLRQAFLSLLGTDLAIDQSLGLGTYQGIKSPLSDVAQWRKVWSRIRREQAALYRAQVAAQDAALEALKAGLEACKAAGVPMQSITQEVLSSLFQNPQRHHVHAA